MWRKIALKRKDAMRMGGGLINSANLQGGLIQQSEEEWTVENKATGYDVGTVFVEI